MSSTTRGPTEVEEWVPAEVVLFHLHLPTQGQVCIDYMTKFLKQKAKEGKWPQGRVHDFILIFLYAKRIWKSWPEHKIEKKCRQAIDIISLLENTDVADWDMEDLLCAWWIYYMLGSKNMLEKIRSYADIAPMTIEDAAVREVALLMYIVHENKGYLV